MKTISKWIEALWAWLNGKKSYIALIYWTIVTPCLPILWPTGIPSTINKVYLIVGIILSAIGLGHAAIKGYQEKRTDSISPPETPAQ